MKVIRYFLQKWQKLAKKNPHGAACAQEPARYYINKRRSPLDAGLVLKPGFESQEGNRSLGFYSRIYGNNIIIIMLFYYTDRLSLNHLQQVLDLVWDARKQYYSIGLALDLSANTIDVIESANNNMPDPTFRKVITECLKKGLVTQKKLAKVVSSPQVSFAYLSAAILAEKFTAPQIPQGEFIIMIRYS
jgi:hypothetical protein